MENDINLQTYLRSLIQTDKERRMQLHIEKYFEENQTNINKQIESKNSLSILKQYLSKMIGYHHPQITTTNNNNDELNIVLDQQLEQGLSEIEQSSDQSLNEMNNLFNEFDNRRKRREIPEYLTCKICYDLMRDPVITPCKLNISKDTNKKKKENFYLVGITYCRSCIEENLYKVGHLDPIANKPLVVDQLINNLVVKEIVEKFIKENEWVNSECY
jgi:STIP1 family protein 1